MSNYALIENESVCRNLVPYNKVTDEQRRIAKTLNFKELYK